MKGDDYQSATNNRGFFFVFCVFFCSYSVIFQEKMTQLFFPCELSKKKKTRRPFKKIVKK